MPEAKLRREMDGKRLKRPDVVNLGIFHLTLDNELIEGEKFWKIYNIPFVERVGDDVPVGAGWMLELITGLFDAQCRVFNTLKMAELYNAMAEPFDWDEGGPDYSLNETQIDAALKFLIDEGMAITTGDAIAIPSRFIEEVAKWPPSARLSRLGPTRNY